MGVICGKNGHLCFHFLSSLFFFLIFARMKGKTPTMHLDMVPPMARTLSLKDEVVISDNLDSRIPSGIQRRIGRGLPTRTLSPSSMTFPYKVAFHVILFVDAGRVDCRINLQDYRIEGCSLFLMPSGMVLDSLTYQAGTRFLIVAYTDAGSLLPVTARSSMIIRAATFSPLYLPVSRERMDRYLQLLRVVLHVGEGGEEYIFKEDIVEGFARVIAGGIARIILEQSARRKTSGRGPDLLRRFVSLVQARCTEHRDLSYYARELCVSAKYLSRVVSEYSGRTASDIIRENVIPQARLLLSLGEYNVQQVSNLLHFPNASYFGRYFLHATGMTPRQYQQQLHR